MTIHWKAVEQYFPVLFVNPLTPRVKPWVIQSFVTFDSIYRTLRCDHSLESCCVVLCCGAVFFDPLTPRVKPWVIQRFLTFDSLDRTLKTEITTWVLGLNPAQASQYPFPVKSQVFNDSFTFKWKRPFA